MPRSKTQHTLSESQKIMYSLERGENFRWIARLLGSSVPASQLTLTAAHRIPPSTQLAISELGQFTEMACGLVNIDFVWKNLESLIRPDYPLEGYDALDGSRLMRVFCGSVASLQGYLVYRPELKQLVVAFSGTISVAQALHDLDSRLVSAESLSPKNVENYTGQKAKVHAGFWRLYQGIKGVALEGLGQAFEDVEVDELVVAGHSMGGSVASYLLLDLLTARPHYLDNISRLCFLTFGSPRGGNIGLKELYKYLVSIYRGKKGESSFEEIAVKGYNDGVHCLPPMALGYHHLYSTPLYLYHGFLYQIPEGFSEFSRFDVEVEDDTPPPDYPLGGHNYYNNRDMERCVRRLQWLDTQNFGDSDSEKRYLDKVAKEEKKRN